MPYTFRQGDLPKLDLQVDRGTDFVAWKAQWDSYISLSELDKELQAKQVQALTLCFSRETLTIVNNHGRTGCTSGAGPVIALVFDHYQTGIRLCTCPMYVYITTVLCHPIYTLCTMYATSSFARFSYSECGLRSLRSLTHMRVMSSLASAAPSVAYVRFARSLTWA